MLPYMHDRSTSAKLKEATVRYALANELRPNVNVLHNCKYENCFRIFVHDFFMAFRPNLIYLASGAKKLL